MSSLEPTELGAEFFDQENGKRILCLMIILPQTAEEIPAWLRCQRDGE